jgi:hypothetical protein
MGFEVNGTFNKMKKTRERFWSGRPDFHALAKQYGWTEFPTDESRFQQSLGHRRGLRIYRPCYLLALPSSPTPQEVIALSLWLPQSNVILRRDSAPLCEQDDSEAMHCKLRSERSRRRRASAVRSVCGSSLLELDSQPQRCHDMLPRQMLAIDNSPNTI